MDMMNNPRKRISGDTLTAFSDFLGTPATESYFLANHE
jgi:hypothetical protein